VEPLSLATPYASPPASPPRPRRRGGVVGPLILIFIGVVFLLENTGYLPPNFWVNLWRLWPLVLVLVGVELLLAHRVPWLALAGLAAIVLVGGAVATNTTILSTEAAGSDVTTSAETDLDGSSQANVTIRFGAGRLTLGPLGVVGPNELASMTYDGPPQLAPTPNYTPSNGGVGQLEYQSSGRGGPGFLPFSNNQGDTAHLDVALAPNVTISALNIQSGATDARLDLSKLKISNLDMSIGAATTWLRFPEAAGLTTAHITGGASTLTLEIPQGVAAQIQHHGGLTTLQVDQSRFPQVNESVYRSPDYNSAANKLDLSIETGVTTIQIS